MITARQGLGASQFTANSIMIVGGFGGKYCDDSLIFDADNNTVKPTDSFLG